MRIFMPILTLAALLATPAAMAFTTINMWVEVPWETSSEANMRAILTLERECAGDLGGAIDRKTLREVTNFWGRPTLLLAHCIIAPRRAP